MSRTTLAATLGLLALSCHAGTTIWSGSFNPYPTVATFDLWSFSDEVGTYQWYIHGAQNTSHYLALDPSFKNPADTAETNGVRVTIDTTSTWNSQMERTELIPQTSANLGTGNLLYHFSISHPSTNLPDLKYGIGPNGSNLNWMVTEVSQWNAPFTPGVWFNFAYDIDFSAGTVGLWASTGSNPLVKVVQNVPASTSTNSEDWHLGVLRIVNGGGPEDWYFSGVYIETAPITTSVGSGSGVGTTSSGSTSTITSTTSVSTTTTTTSTTTTAAGPTQTEWGQCGGNGWTGPTVCQSPFTCTPISPPFYSQCL